MYTTNSHEKIPQVILFYLVALAAVCAERAAVEVIVTVLRRRGHVHQVHLRGLLEVLLVGLQLGPPGHLLQAYLRRAVELLLQDFSDLEDGDDELV